MHATVAREYSKRLGKLTDDQFQAALNRFDLGRLVRAEPIPFGNFGQNVFLTCSTGEFVLRGSPHYTWQFPKERFFSQLLHDWTSAPVPWPYLLDPTDDIFGWSFAIMPRLPGIQLSDPHAHSRLSAADRHGIARAVGETLAELHRLTWPFAGEYELMTDTIQPLGVGFAEWVVSQVRDRLRVAIPLSDRTTRADVEWVERVISRGRDALRVPFQPCFVMRDFKEGNATAACTDGIWHISGVFDLMESYFGDGEADLSRSAAGFADEDPDLARSFVQAYVQHLSARDSQLRPGYAERFPIYMLLDRLILWQFGQRHGVWWDADLTLRKWASPYTSLAVF